jgi:protein ImuA
MKRGADKSIIEELQRQILKWQGNQPTSNQEQALGLGPIEHAFPGKIFPRAAVHELISSTSETAASTNGFMAVLLQSLLQHGRSCVWISTRRTLFPPALKAFGMDPEQIIFIDVKRAKEGLWVMEEALKCSTLAAVVGEITELDFNESRRLQLAVEQSRVTGFIHRYQPRMETILACASRWKIIPLSSDTLDEMPGIGFPKWDIHLLKVRNGKPGKWQAQWLPQGLEWIHPIAPEVYEQQTA